mgnify:FL=1
MLIPVQCKCGWNSSVPDTLAGSQVKCPNCSTMVDVPRASLSTGNLYKEAIYQRQVIILLLLKVILVLLPILLGPKFGDFVDVDIYALIVVILLANVLFGGAGAVVCAMFLLIPVASGVLGWVAGPAGADLAFMGSCMGIFIALGTLLFLNGSATSYLRKHGVRVGLFGANLEKPGVYPVWDDRQIPGRS